METKDNPLDKLMRNTLKEGSSGDDAALWNRIDKTLKYKGFLRFSFSSFNIYYSVALLLIIASAYFIWNNNQENNTAINNDIKTNISKPQQTINSENTSNTTSVIPDQNQDPKLYKNIVLSDPNSNETNDAKTVKNFPDNTDSNSTQKVKKVKIIKKQVVITDTIRKKDTIYIKK
jgi:hypothetical protein